MSMNSAALKERLEDSDPNGEELVVAYQSLVGILKPTISVPRQGDWGDPARIRQYSLGLSQVLLNRLIRLFEGSVDALLSENGYSLALCVRASFETTAVIGFLHKQLKSLKGGNLAPETVDRDLCVQLLGTRDKDMLAQKWKHEVPEAKQVLTMLEYADASFSSDVLNGTTKQHTILTNSYLWLSEFCHPNFHSHTLAFDLDVDRQEYRLRRNDPLRQHESSIIGYLLLSSPAFERFHDGIVDIVSELG